jgi:hypothetical protein
VVLPSIPVTSYLEEGKGRERKEERSEGGGRDRTEVKGGMDRNRPKGQEGIGKGGREGKGRKEGKKEPKGVAMYASVWEGRC